MSTARRGILVTLAIVLLSGCTFNRAAVSELSREQQAYYQRLDETLKAGGPDLKAGLEAQLQANNWRRRKLNEWSYDLQRAEVLLQVDDDVTGNKQLLSFQLAQLDLQRVDGATIRDETSARHVNAIMDLYRKMQKAVSALQKNNNAIIEYLGSGDREFVIRSIDVDGIVAAVAGIQNAREQLGELEARTAAERAEERVKVQRSVDRARDTLLRVFDLSK